LLRAALRFGFIAILTLVASLSGSAQEPPSIPSEFYLFPANFTTGYGSPPTGYTNIASAPLSVDPQSGIYGNALILDTTNLAPAFLNYPVLETNYGAAHRNLFYSSGTVLFYFCPNWQSAGLGDGATGPGQTAYFIGGGGLVQQFAQWAVCHIRRLRWLESLLWRCGRWGRGDLRQRTHFVEFKQLASNRGGMDRVGLRDLSGRRVSRHG